MTKFYKIRNRATGLYSKGGSDAFYSSGSKCWNKSGKTWAGLGPLRNHLQLIITNHNALPPDWEVVEFTVTESASTPIEDMITDKQLVKILTQ